MKFFSVFIVFTICIVTISCNRKMYYSTVKDNTSDFDFILSYLQKNKFLELNDSIELRNTTTIHFGNKCLYTEQTHDILLSSFMRKYDLNRICFHKDKSDFYDSVIIFHKNYNPILGPSITINYDFGGSKLRDKVKGGIKFPNQAAVILNDQYIYLAKSKPAFGE